MHVTTNVVRRGWSRGADYDSGGVVKVDPGAPDDLLHPYFLIKATRVRPHDLRPCLVKVWVTCRPACKLLYALFTFTFNLNISGHLSCPVAPRFISTKISFLFVICRIVLFSDVICIVIKVVTCMRTRWA